MAHALSLFALLSVFLFTTDAEAQTRGLRPEIHADLGFQGFLGLGGGVEFAIVPDGFITRFEDELTLIPGFDFLFFDFDDDNDDDELGFAPHVAARWNVYLSERWSVFPELGFVTLFVTGDRDGDGRFYRGYGRRRNVYFDPIVAAGARLHLASRFEVTFRVGYPFGAQIGLAF